ncbi:MAG: hypothetical protein LPK45_05020, partial [Bacteroidota bacterium]|nr:hypothetical protein [Bacteroidota bacterium]MDX5430421.1 hypothetical protein [Bacteroidota bacterium]MDX5469180.1 hypothetical protein [Bacteroidota bacterium]
MKMNVKSTALMLFLSLGTMTLVQSCQKDPCYPPKDKPVMCNMEGTVALEPGFCATPPGESVGIMDDLGVFYFIKTDLTQSFANVKLGDRVRFGYSAIAVISSKEG